MRPIVRTIHVYLGLLMVTTLVVFAIIGITAAAGWNEPAEEAPVVTTMTFGVPGDRTDAQLVAAILAAGVTDRIGPGQSWWLTRDPDGSTVLGVTGLNGSQRIRVDEPAQQLEISTSRSTLRTFLSRTHASASHPATDLRLRLWAGYVELSAWALIGLAASGAWLGRGSRHRCGPAWYAGLAGTALVLVLLGLTR